MQFEPGSPLWIVAVSASVVIVTQALGYLFEAKRRARAIQAVCYRAGRLAALVTQRGGGGGGAKKASRAPSGPSRTH